MTVPSRVRMAVGVVSTATFLGLGALLLLEGRTGVASVLLAVGAFRGAWLVRDLAPWD